MYVRRLPSSIMERSAPSRPSGPLTLPSRLTATCMREAGRPARYVRWGGPAGPSPTIYIIFGPAGRAMALVIDAQVAGISGDMLLCSLVHMGADASRVESGVMRAASGLGGEELRGISFERVRRRGLEATALRVESSGAPHSRAATELEARIASSAAGCGLSPRAAAFAASSARTLIAAESAVHGVEASSVHLHEAAGVDTLVDILGTAIALDDLGALRGRVVCTPVAVGGGLLEFSHGTASNPAGAILEIFRGRGIEIRGGPAASELTTPTGASMLVSLASECVRFYPPLCPAAVGYGAGSADHEGFPNVLKAVRGEEDAARTADTVRVLETNVDDVPGDVMAHAIEGLMARGALDVTVTPGITKKGRPTSSISVICGAGEYEDVLGALMGETGTLGVRVRDAERVVARRDSATARVSVGGRDFEVRYKAARGAPPRVEHDDVARVAVSLGMPLAQARRLVDGAVAGGA